MFQTSLSYSHQREHVEHIAKQRGRRRGSGGSSGPWIAFASGRGAVTSRPCSSLCERATHANLQSAFAPLLRYGCSFTSEPGRCPALYGGDLFLATESG